MEATGTAERDGWRAALVSEMSGFAGVLSELVPELALVLGESPDDADLDAADARRRLHRAAIRLLSATASYPPGGAGNRRSAGGPTETRCCCCPNY